MGWRLCPGVSCTSSAFLLLVTFIPEQGSLKESRARPGGDVQHSYRRRQGCDAHELQVLLEMTLVLPVLSEVVLGFSQLLPLSSFGCFFFFFFFPAK